MRILFVHQNFPGQFKHLAPELAKNKNQVIALSMTDSHRLAIPQVQVIQYQANRSTSTQIHPWVADFETKVIRGHAAFNAAINLKNQGFSPDVIVAHPGWGESMFLKEVWPNAQLGIYCEFYYHTEGADTNFDAEFSSNLDIDRCRVQIKNANSAVHFPLAKAGISPTHWQASTFPDIFRSKISVIHDGIDTELIRPRPDVRLQIKKGTEFTKNDEIITFVNRNLEPYRGYHSFMRALPSILKARPNAHVLIVGGDDVSYGSRPLNGQKWKNIFLDEVRENLDLSRVHFLGNLPYEHYIAVMQLSSVHVYLTYPFVLSWSLLEAMSIGAAVVASNTAPVLEAIKDGETGLLVDFFNKDSLVAAVVSLLENPQERARLGRAARDFARKNYDLKTICLPRQIDWVTNLIT